MESLPGYDTYKLSGPPEPPKYVTCKGCGSNALLLDDALFVERSQTYWCPDCTRCHSCLADAIEQCEDCGEWTCAGCFRRWSLGMDRETGVMDEGRCCRDCYKSLEE